MRTPRPGEQAGGEVLAEVLTVQGSREAALSSDSQGISESQMSELDRQTDTQCAGRRHSRARGRDVQEMTTSRGRAGT